MSSFLNIVKITAINAIKFFWVTILILIIGYLLYQSSFSWGTSEEVTSDKALTNKEEVVFIVIKEEYAGVKKNGFDSLSTSLKTWEFDKRERKLYLKYQKSLPYTTVGTGHNKEMVYDKTKVMILYDRGFDSFERYSEVLSVASLPYQYFFNGEPLITVNNVDAEGTVFLEYKGKQIQLKAEENYPEVTFKGFKLSRTEIQNHGIYKKNQFLPFESDVKDDKKDNKDKDDEKDKKQIDGEDIKLEIEKLPNIHS